MMNKVSWLDELFHTVRLELGSMLDGRMKGNMDSPAVEMIPKVESLEPIKVMLSELSLSPMSAANAPPKPRTGASIIQGWAA